MPDNRELRTNYNKHSTRINRYFELRRYGRKTDEKFNSKTREIDGNHNTKRIVHEILNRDDYNVFHEIFKLNRKEINKMIIPLHNQPTAMQIQFKEYLKMMRRRNKALVK